MGEGAALSGPTASADQAPIYSRATGLRMQAIGLRESLESIEATMHGSAPCPPPSRVEPQPEGPMNLWALLTQAQESLQLAAEAANRLGGMIGTP